MSRGGMERRDWILLAALCAMALGVRLAFALRLPPTIVWFDGYQYSRLANGLMRYGTYLNAKGHPSAFWPPGYPAFLAAVYTLFGPSVIAVRVTQSVLGALTVALAHGIARRVLDVRGAWLATVVTALYPIYVYSATAFFPVTLLAALMAAVLLLVLVALERRSTLAAVVAGSLAGWAALTAGSSLAVLLVCAAWMPWRGAGPRLTRTSAAQDAIRARAAGARLALVFLLPAVLIVGAWTLRNERVFGHPVLVSTNAGYNFWLGNYPGVRAETGNTFFSDSMEAEANAVWATPGNEQTREQCFWRLARGHVAGNVPHFVQLTASKALFFWSVYTNPMTRGRPTLSFEELASWLSYGLLLPFALAWLAWSLRRDPTAVLVLLLCVSYTAIHACVLSKVRLRLPLDTLVIVYGAGGVVAAWDRLSRWRGRASQSP